VLGATACSGNDDAVPETTTPAATTTLVAPRVEDARLRLGVLLPSTDTLLGAPLLAAVESAVDEINDAGGVLGRPVTTVVADDATGATAIGDLIDADVDAVIGPASSMVALSGLGEFVQAGVMTCSPTATALALDEFPDAGLFFRTIPSDSMQAEVIAGEAEATGEPTAAIAHIDDAYGRDFVNAVDDAMATRSVEIVETVAFVARDDDFSDEARALAQSAAEILIVLGTGADSARFLAALDEQDLPANIPIIVNGDIRAPDAQPLIESLSPGFRTRIGGVAPQAVPGPGSEPSTLDGAYAVNAYDCVNLVALSSMLANSTIGLDMVRQVQQATANGSTCATFEECKTSFDDDLNFNYVGPTGILEINADGEPVRSNFVRFTYDETGRDETQPPFRHPA
jgi:branched-chain amino acid transport system substrate-binding protein